MQIQRCPTQKFFCMNQLYNTYTSFNVFIYLLFIPKYQKFIRKIFEKNKDISDLTIRGVQNLVLELETRPHPKEPQNSPIQSME